MVLLLFVSFSERCKTPCNEGEVCGCFVACYHIIIFFSLFLLFLLFITFLLLFYFIGLFCIVFKGFYDSSSLLFSPTLTDRHTPPQSDILGHLHPHSPSPPVFTGSGWIASECYFFVQKGKPLYRP